MTRNEYSSLAFANHLFEWVHFEIKSLRPIISWYSLSLSHLQLEFLLIHQWINQIFFSID